MQENVNYNQEENKPIESDLEVKEMRKLTKNNFKTAILNIHKELKENRGKGVRKKSGK